MSSLAPVLALAAPLCLAGAAVLAGTEPGRRPALALKAGTLGTVAALAAAVLAATFLLLGGFDLGPIVPFTVPVHLDALSAVMLVLVTFLGTIIVGFSRNYLDGDERQGLFIAWLCLTLAAVALLVIAGNLFILVGAWIATSLALHRLLTFYRGRRLAMAAAGKKFITARAGDVCLITAAILLYLAFGSADMGVILDTAERIGAGEAGGLVTWAGFLIAFAAILKSAQFPTHGWLLEVMETPTPVSALLHAGVVNAGGFLVLRFADVMVLAAGTLPLLAIVGAATAVIGSAVMLRQSSVKVALAWSTIAQMGFMLLQCGLGAFSLAALHIVAHSLYKAHAFLSSGSAVDLARSEHPVRTGASPSVRIFLPVLVAGLAAGYGVAAVAGLDLRADAGELALGAILVMALSILFSRQLTVGSSAALFARLTLLAGAVSVAYLVLHTVAFWVMGSALPPAPEQGPVALLIQALIVFSFMTLTIAQVCGYLGTGSRSPRGFAVHLANGFYANAWFDRIVGSYRLTGSGQR